MNLKELLIKEVKGEYTGNAKDVWKLNEDIREYHKEVFVILFLDTKNKIIKREIVSIGTLNSCEVHPRDVFREAILTNCNSIILVHNHPSGDTTPSDDDITITDRLSEIGDLLKIKVLDHVIVTKDHFHSIVNS